MSTYEYGLCVVCRFFALGFAKGPCVNKPIQAYVVYTTIGNTYVRCTLAFSSDQWIL
jgi:hypothetical protein